MRLLRAGFIGIALTACSAAAPPATTVPASPAQPTSQATLTPQAFLPAVSDTGQKTILFINGDHMPETSYPHSRVNDDGTKPESFLRLRKEVLEEELNAKVDEFILTAGTAISPALLVPNTLVVLGSNGRVLQAGEVTALADYFNAGGRVLIYADFQYGPDNWASDNSFLNQFGIEVFPDNFQPSTQITDVVSSHPIMEGVTSFATEGSSQFLIKANSLVSNTVLSKCSPLERSGCAVQTPEQAKIEAGDVVACTWVRENAAGGKMAGTCDRNTFHNGPGPGTDIDQFNNRIYARNLFRWLLQ
jgi:hypothetical protein